jgi:protein TonB
VELRNFLKTNLQYPQRALELALEGKCYLQFVVRKNGSIDSLVVKRGIIDCPECDQEALRLVGIMPPWIPGKVNGITVDSYVNLPLIFKIY